jgi:Na+-transporting methylmalonyl-CoA/oxaloacetate decarboxylase gamma subunit
VITNPLALVNDIFQMVINPGDYMYVWGMTACFSVLMLIIYYTVRAAGKEIRRF